jgi:hypothetical protein
MNRSRTRWTKILWAPIAMFIIGGHSISHASTFVQHGAVCSAPASDSVDYDFSLNGAQAPNAAGVHTMICPLIRTDTSDTNGLAYIDLDYFSGQTAAGENPSCTASSVTWNGSVLDDSFAALSLTDSIETSTSLAGVTSSNQFSNYVVVCQLARNSSIRSIEYGE